MNKNIETPNLTPSKIEVNIDSEPKARV